MSERSVETHDALVEAIERLRSALLPATFEPTGAYEPPHVIHLHTVSFRILVHAEMESYIENLADSLFQTAWSEWTSKGLASKVVAGLLAFSGRDQEAAPTSRADKPTLDTCIQKAQAVWRDAHRSNHGLKERNLMRLFLPLGIAAEDIDATLISDLDSFGVDRGTVAHASALKMSSLADPKTEYDRALQLARSLRSLEELVLRSTEDIHRLSQAMVKQVAPATGFVRSSIPAR